MSIVRMRYVLGERTLVVLSYQVPAWILGPLGTGSLPISLTTTSDIPVMMSVRQWFIELVLVITIGAHNVDRYHFNWRDNFVVGGSVFLLTEVKMSMLRENMKLIIHSWLVLTYLLLFILHVFT